MYERSAIVLERYFANLLGFNEEKNTRQNFKNYCDLFEKFNVFQVSNSEEFDALTEFQASENAIEEIQASEEKLYKKNAKLEYNRDLIFSDITQKPEEIEKCITKIENDISKNQATLISLREKFVEEVRVYNEKKSKLTKCKKNRKNAEKEYNLSFDILKESIENIEEQYVEIAKNFANEEREEELISIMTNNGKEEKIPFNNSVLTYAAKLGFDVLKREAECYVEAYKMSKKLIEELLEGAVSVELHQKVIRNINVKLNFLNAEKEYLIQFLDYERITVIYGKRTHRTLMVEACEKFEFDVEQINNLYTLLLKEIDNKSTKKAYKELYNKSYLIDIEEKEAKFKKEKSKMNLPVGTIMNSNYWRIEGIKNIYTVFYKDVSEVFGKDLVEFDLPKEPDEVEINDSIIDNSNDIQVEEQKVQKTQIDEVKANAVKSEVIKIEEPKVEEIKAEESQTEAIVQQENKKLEDAIAELETVEELLATESANIEETTEKFDEVTEIPQIEEIEEVFVEQDKPETFESIEVKEKTSKKSKAKKVKRYTRKIISNEEILPETVERIEATEPQKNEVEKIEVTEPQKNEKVENFEEIEDKKKAKKAELKKEKKNKKEKIKKVEKIEKVEKVEKTEDVEILETSLFDKTNEEAEEYDIFEDKYREIEKQIAELDDLDTISIEEIVENTPYEDDEMDFEESIFGDIENENYEELSLKKNDKSRNKKSKSKKKGIFNKLMKMNSKEKKEVNS